MYADFDVASLTSTGPSILVSNEEEFYAAAETLSSGTGGTIVLSSDMERAQLQLKNLGPETGELIITSEDPENPTVMAGVRLISSENITVSGLEFDSEDFERSDYLVDFMAQQSSGITFVGNIMNGPAIGLLDDSDHAKANGVLVRDTDDVVFSDNYIAGYIHAVGFENTTNVVFSGNELTELQGDAIHGGAWHDFLIEDNYFHDMYGSSQEVSHSDMIQVWSVDGKGSTDLTIRNNIFDSGEGPVYQSIFIRHAIGATEDVYHQDIVIENNVIHNGMTNAVRVMSTNNLSVTNNTVLWNQYSKFNSEDGAPAVSMPQINLTGIGDFVVEGNIAPKISASDGVDVSDNALVNYDTPSAENYVLNHFVNQLIGGEVALTDLQLLPDSDWNGEYGSSMSQAVTATDDVTAVIRQEFVAGDRASLVLDGTYSTDEFGYLDDDRASFLWTFADGTTQTGAVITHDFGDDHGLQEVTLTVTTEDGEVSALNRDVFVQGANIAEIDFESDLTDLIDADSLDAAHLVSGSDGTGYLLDGSNGLELKMNNDFFNLDTFALQLDVDKASADSAGYLMHFHQTLRLVVEDDGALTFKLTTDEGEFTLSSDAGVLADTQWHQVGVAYSDAANSLQLFVDGDKVGEMAASGTTTSKNPYSMDFGTNPWRDGVEAVIDNFSFVADASALHDGTMMSAPISAAPAEDTDALDDLIDDILGEDDAVAQEDPVVEDVADPAPVEDTPVVEDVAEDIAEDIGDEVEDDTGFLQDLVSDILQGDATDQAEEPAAPVEEEDEPVDAEVEEPVVVEGIENTDPEDTVTEDEDIVTEDTDPQDVAPDVSEEVEDDPIVIEEPAVVEEPAPQATTEDEDSGNFLANIFQSLFGIFGALFGGGEKSDAAEAATDKGAASQAELSQTDSQLISLPDADDLLDSLTLENSELSETSIYTDLDQAYIGYEQQAQDAHYAGL